MKIKHPKFFWGVNAGIVTVVSVVWFVEPLHTTVAHWMHEGWEFLKAYAMSLFAAFFLVKGKFILNVFLKRLFFMSATGLSKRYLIEKVFTYHLKEHFIKHIKRDIRRLFSFIKRNFMRFSLGRKIIAAFAVLGSLGYVSKFMGAMLALKVFVAKIWSFLLAVVLKAANWFIYFFTDYIWGSWLGPIVEVVIFSWLVSFLEKVPLLKRLFGWLYRRFIWLVRLFDAVSETLLHRPLRRAFKWLVRRTKRLIARFIGYKPLSSYFKLLQLRRMKPSRYVRLKQNKRSRYAELKARKKPYRFAKATRRSRFEILHEKRLCERGASVYKNIECDD